MASVIFNGDYVKALKNKFKLSEDAYIISGESADPTVTAFDAPAGSIYIRTDGNIYRKEDSGSTTNWQLLESGKALNYIPNPDFENNLNDWNLYNDGAVSAPVDGTGGASSLLSVTRQTVYSETLRGSASMRIAKAAGNAQGEGISTDFIIDRVDIGKTLSFSIDHKNSVNYAQGDVVIYLYDITNSVLIGTLTSDIDGELIYNDDKGVKTTGSFQIPDNTGSLRLIVHVASTNASAWTLTIDTVVLSPSPQTVGYNSTEWTQFTPTSAWSVAVVHNGQWRRDGDTMEIDYSVECLGAPNVGNLSFNMVPGYTVDTSKLSTSVAFGYTAGHGSILDSANTVWVNTAVWNGSAFQVYAGRTTGQDNLVSHANPMAFAAGDIVTVRVRVPIVGWTNSSVMDTNELSLQTISCTAGNSSGQSILSGDGNQYVTNWTEETDTHNAFDPVTGTFTCPRRGKLKVRFDSAIAPNATGLREAVIRKNGVTVAFQDFPGTTGVNTAMHTEWDGNVNKGDEIRPVVFQTSGSALNLRTDVRTNRLHIEYKEDFTTLGVVHQGNQLIESKSSLVAYPGAAGAYVTLTSITLEPNGSLGYDLSFFVHTNNNGVMGSVSNMEMGISTTPGPTPTGLVYGENFFAIYLASAVSTVQYEAALPKWHVTPTTTQTYYLVAQKFVSVANLQVAYKLSARKIT